MSEKAKGEIGRVIWLPIAGVETAHVVVDSEPVTLPVEVRRKDGKGVDYLMTGYVATSVRPATREEVERWKAG